MRRLSVICCWLTWGPLKMKDIQCRLWRMRSYKWFQAEGECLGQQGAPCIRMRQLEATWHFWPCHLLLPCQAGGGGFESYPKCRMIWGGPAGSSFFSAETCCNSHLFLSVERPSNQKMVVFIERSFFKVVCFCWPMCSSMRHRQHPCGERCLACYGECGRTTSGRPGHISSKLQMQLIRWWHDIAC